MKWRSMPSDTRRPISTRMRQVHIFTRVKVGKPPSTMTLTHTQTHAHTYIPTRRKSCWTRKLPRETFGLFPPTVFPQDGSLSLFKNRLITLTHSICCSRLPITRNKSGQQVENIAKRESPSRRLGVAMCGPNIV